MSPTPSAPPFRYLGERLCLDFVNTEVMEDGARVDLLDSFGDLASFCAGAQMLTGKEAHDVASRWSGTPDGNRALKKAVDLRAALREMAERLASGQPRVPQRILDAINDVLQIHAGVRAIVRTVAGYETRYRDRFTEPAHLLVPIAESAADLLAAGDLSLVRKCQNDRCILFFYDTTRNHARRWCSMTGCGNRAKVAAHYRRQRGDARD